MSIIEQALEKSIFSQGAEKTAIDKVLAREDINRAREIIKKKDLSREDISELMYIITSTESKLVNYNEWDRYIILKFFVWIRELIKTNEIMFDFREKLETRKNICRSCYKEIETKKDDKCLCEKKIPVLQLTENSQEMMLNISRLVQHNIKFLVDLYLNLSRTTLSLGGHGFFELLKNKFEIDYKQDQKIHQTSNDKKHWWSSS